LCDDGPGSSDPRDFFIINNHLYFFAETANTGRELYITDGTRETTRLIRDTIVGPDGQEFSRNVFGNDTEKYFLGPNSEIWRTDGTHSGTEIAVPLGADFNGILGYIDEDLIYVSGIELFKINSTSNEPTLIHTFDESCRQIRNLVPEFQFGSVDPADAILLSVFCSVHTSNTSNYSAWVTDGTSAGTSPIPGFATGLAIFFGELNGRYYFEVLCNIRDCQESLVHTDGYSTTTVINEESRATIRVGSALVNNELAFRWSYEIWLTDGTERNTRPLTDFGMAQKGLANIGDNLLYFQGRNFESINELWISDGTAIGTRKHTGFGASTYVTGLTIGNRHYFLLDNENDAIELWVIDSSLAAPRELAAFNRNTVPPAGGFNLTAEGQRLYFRGSDRVWHSDGTVGETFPLIYTSPEVFQGPVMSFLNAIYYLLMDDDEEEK